MIRPHRIAPALLALVVVAISACGGGGSAGTGGSSSTGILPGTPQSGQRLGVTLASASGSLLPFFSARHAMASTTASGQAVTVTYNGATVATGTLDGNGFVELTFTQAVPSGATVTVTIGSGATAVVASVTLSQAISATASDIVYSAGPPPVIKVQTSDDTNGTGQVTANDPNQSTDTENPSDGQVQDVNSNSPTLPANLPVAITSCGSTITITPTLSATGPIGLTFEEKTSDGSGSAQYEYAANPFATPLTFPILSSAARVDMTITQNGATFVTIEAPLSSLLSTGSGGASPSPSASPSACPTLSPNVPT
ncbi:MAG: hypothetical protein ACYDA1_03465 [Vulcanimicrobiaceae bacterium]